MDGCEEPGGAGMMMDRRKLSVTEGGVMDPLHAAAEGRYSLHSCDCMEPGYAASTPRTPCEGCLGDVRWIVGQYLRAVERCDKPCDHPWCAVISDLLAGLEGE